MPFGSLLVSGLIAAWFLTSFFVMDRSQLKKGLSSVSFWIPVSFFILTAASAALSENAREAAFSIEVKLAFIVMPWLLNCFTYPPGILQRFIVSFVSGCFFACVCLLARAVYYAFHGTTDYFFYTLFSSFIHASYFAMYLNLAIVFVIVLYPAWFRERRSAIYSSWFFVAVFTACIFLCASKIGIMTFVIVTPLALYHHFRTRLRRIHIITAIVLLLSIPFILAAVSPGIFERFRNISVISRSDIDKTTVESTGVRMLIWPQAAELIRQHPLTGTGVGDVNDRLYEQYRMNGITGAYEHRFNAHNQYLQTFAGIGLAGIICLLLLTAGPLFSRNILAIAFAFLIITNFMVESMLQTAAGVVFFTFFYCLLAGGKRAERLFTFPPV